jgi:hypothetical protein
MDREDLAKKVEEWIGKPPVYIGDEEPPAERQYHGTPQWYLHEPAPDEEILTEHPDAQKRRIAKAYSLTYGWIHDCIAAVFYLVMSWFTTDVVAGIMRATYGLIMLGLVGAIFYCTFYAADRPSPRTLPRVDALMKTDPEGSSQTSGMSEDTVPLK